MKKSFSTSEIIAYILGKAGDVPGDDYKPVVHEIGELARTGRFDVEKGLIDIKRRIRRAKTIRLYRCFTAAAVVCLFVGVLMLYRETGRVLPQENGEGMEMAEQNSFSGNVELLVQGKEKVCLPDSGRAVVKAGKEVALVDTGEACLSFKEELAEAEIPESEYYVLRIPRKTNYKLELADGSCVYLNAETEIAFPPRFGKKERKVILKSGEAYFEVAPNPKAPFRVEVWHMELQVLGTSFNVNCYTGNITTTLVEGSLKVKRADEEVVLLPGEQALVDGEQIRVSEVDRSLYTAWKDGLFIFRRLELEAILKTMQRWYDFEYVFKNEALKTKRFTGTIDKNRDKEDAFRAICKAVGIKITENNNCVVIE